MLSIAIDIHGLAPPLIVVQNAYVAGAFFSQELPGLRNHEFQSRQHVREVARARSRVPSLLPVLVIERHLDEPAKSVEDLL